MQIITIDNWEDPLGFTLSSMGESTSVFYIIIVLFGQLFVQKLVLAVMADSFTAENKKANDAKNRRKSARKQRRMTEVAATSDQNKTLKDNNGDQTSEESAEVGKRLYTTRRSQPDGNQIDVQSETAITVSSSYKRDIICR